MPAGPGLLNYLATPSNDLSVSQPIWIDLLANHVYKCCGVHMLIHVKQAKETSLAKFVLQQPSHFFCSVLLCSLWFVLSLHLFRHTCMFC
jgi:hypothetical protein